MQKVYAEAFASMASSGVTVARPRSRQAGATAARRRGLRDARFAPTIDGTRNNEDSR
jgi:hypothetical protein